MPTNIVVIGGNSGTAGQSATFLDMWSDKFWTSARKFEPWDIVGSAAGLYTGGISALATRGLTQEMTIATENAYRLGAR